MSGAVGASTISTFGSAGARTGGDPFETLKAGT